MSLSRVARLAAVLGWSFAAAAAVAQYPGLITKEDKSKKEPVLRSVAVVEWTGAPGKPSASRVIPVSVYDGEQLNDGTIYLTRPEPLALAGGVEYELQTDGKPTGIFDVFGAGSVDGAWQGVGVWKPLSAADTKKAEGAFNTSSLMNGKVDIEDDDKPVLKRKHPKGTDTDDASAKPADGSSKTGGDDDPDRPKLKRKAGDSSNASDSSAGSGSGGAIDPDRPTLHRARHADSDMQVSNAAPDPDRPRLRHGRPDTKTTESPRLEGLPPTMQQAVGVSDARSESEHPWKYSWANPEDETKMKVALEAMARTELGMDAPVAPVKKTAKNAAGQVGQAGKGPAKATATPVRKKTSMLAADVLPLADEHFRVFELAYGATATMVLTASTPKPEVEVSAAPAAGSDAPQDGPPVIKRGKPTSAAKPLTEGSASGSKVANPIAKSAPQKFVTLIAQPDLYGGVLVLYKSVTDSAHLDEKPRMRLIDAVDAMGDNRGELLFELRGETQRQFGLFRVLRGSAEQLFATGPTPTVAIASEMN